MFTIKKGDDEINRRDQKKGLFTYILRILHAEISFARRLGNSTNALCEKVIKPENRPFDLRLLSSIEGLSRAAGAAGALPNGSREEVKNLKVRLAEH
jgi:hypothetical protein